MIFIFIQLIKLLATIAKIPIMKFYSITRNGTIIKSALTEDELKMFFPALIEEYSDGYIYDEETKQVYNEVAKFVVADEGDMSAVAGDDLYEVIEEED